MPRQNDPKQPDPYLTAALENIPPGKALDLACGDGRHSRWLAERGWHVTGIDREQADLEKHEYQIEPKAWDLIVCWLYWQEDLMPEVAGGVRPGGIVALAGKTEGRFATSLENYRKVFQGWTELSAEQTSHRTHFIARRPSI
jgi:SAM-dependent methyltransferase